LIDTPTLQHVLRRPAGHDWGARRAEVDHVVNRSIYNTRSTPPRQRRLRTCHRCAYRSLTVLAVLTSAEVRTCISLHQPGVQVPATGRSVVAQPPAPAHHRPASSSRSAHHHPAHAPRGVRLSRKYGGHHPPQTQRIRINTGRARSTTSRGPPKILSQPAGVVPDLGQRIRAYLVTAVLPIRTPQVQPD